MALEHGTITVDQPLNYYNQFAGAASYLPPGDQEIGNMVQIALVGTSVGTDTGTIVGKRELFSFSYSVTLEPEVKGVIQMKRSSSRVHRRLPPLAVFMSCRPSGPRPSGLVGRVRATGPVTRPTRGQRAPDWRTAWAGGHSGHGRVPRPAADKAV